MKPNYEHPFWCGRIRRARLKRKLTQAQLAEAIDVSTASINKWENRKHIPDDHSKRKLSEFLGIEL